jgi:UDPglucose 6-dehydrogenase
MSKVCVVGTGYVGLVSAACFAELGHHVIGAEKSEEKVRMLEEGKIPIYEPGLGELVVRNKEAGRLTFTTDTVGAVKECNIIFICVGTPAKDDGSADLSQVEEVARSVAETMEEYKLVVEKSTVPVKTSDWVKKTMNLYNRRGIEFDVASNPEFLREGSAVDDFLRPDRIVIGVESEKAEKLLTELYSGIDAPIIVTNINTAEIIKHASNAILATKISFINMVANLCEKAGADVKLVAEGMGLDKRIGPAFLDAGVGWGGSCFPKDVKAFIRIGREYGLNFELLESVKRINDERIDIILDHLHQALWIAKGKTIGILGLAFKPNTDDIRDAPSISLIKRLTDEGALLQLYDPEAMKNMRQVFPEDEGIKYVSSPYEAAEGAHALLIVTEWDEFKTLNLGRIKDSMLTPIFCDGRNIFEKEDMAKHGFVYFPMGR